jgi:hypothetical protein
MNSLLAILELLFPTHGIELKPLGTTMYELYVDGKDTKHGFLNGYRVHDNPQGVVDIIQDLINKKVVNG